jgi:hypothetical protein
MSQTINEGERIKLIVALGADAITGNSVEIFSLNTDDEATRLRESLCEIFNSAGWKAKSNLNRKVVGHPFGGVLVEINPRAGNYTRILGARVVAVLKEVGLDASGPESSCPMAGNASIEIIVGGKP